MGKEKDRYSDFSNVESQNLDLTSEEFPEGSFGSDGYESMDKPVYNRSKPWESGQRYSTPFNYENKTLHEDLPRQFPNSHPTHDDPEKSKEPPYEDIPEK